MKRQVIIVGAGASGLTAAIQAARQGASVTVLEHTAKPGKKLLSTGNGKCNLTNLITPENAYRGGQLSFIKRVLENITVGQTLEFFRDLGLVLTDRNGYVYPNSGQAASVLNALLFELEHLGVSIVTDCQVIEIKKDLSLVTSKGEKRADALILAAGSSAAPKTGSDGSGYELAKALGHKIIKPLPALVQLRCREKWYKQAAGVRTEAFVTLKIDGKTAAADRGELQFTDYGISGIPVFQISRYAVRGIDAGQQVTAELDFLPSMNIDNTRQFLSERVKRLGYRRAEEFLNGVLNHKLNGILLKEAGIMNEGLVKNITPVQINRLVSALKGLKTNILASNSFDQAQVCSGGIDTMEVDPDTMESKLINGLYLAGEILDADGICGGYNLQWAWSCGILAGTCAGKGISNRCIALKKARSAYPGKHRQE
ncbi:NAD(P)/FAD-dependent oxidoreductase [Lacrimispora saccharolytica]|uniref:HI0933 family protein n=1 Tax=Lacrimispora saccharolytica (strain ATCC 35040 / DSM 2544 / NRCC 2533 / WM1) TaxID=610130 RepID=D9R196_LACSW|nr:NAD(P)/FAD-dependent oxidoreductase [Lacrimispora saccharolytica]ADL04643.1 HI0933 family protein [[Clostridium] saccharolyticum WM1]QRV21123.1 NAD(P)/FAD-dependent oxidoreductase [Lacrimispora saccharolytica]